MNIYIHIYILCPYVCATSYVDLPKPSATIHGNMERLYKLLDSLNFKNPIVIKTL